MATRFYTVGTAGFTDVTPSSWSAGWNKTTGAITRGLFKSVNPQPSATSQAIAASGTSGHFTAIARFVSGPLAAQTISGNIKGQFVCIQTNTTDNYTLAVAIKVIKPDGTDRGVVLAVTASDDTSATPPEMATTSTNRRLLDAIESASIALSSLAVTANDRLVIEVGYRQASTSVANGTLAYGNTGAADLPENDTTASGTAWVEFDGTIALSEIWHYGSASNPADNGAANEPVTLAVTPPAAMLAGDLVLLIGQIQAADATLITLSQQGGQTWTGPAGAAANDQAERVWWCEFDGTWDANPSIAFGAVGGTQAATAIMHVFRGDAARTWTEDTAFAGGAEASASPTVITGITPANDTNVTLAAWAIPNVSDWVALSGAGWAVTGADQYRNTAGSDQSSTYAHQVQHTKGATGDVSEVPSTAAAGISWTMAWYLPSSNKELVADAGSHTITGTAAGTQLGRVVAADAGSYAIAGTDATLVLDIPLVADAGSHVITGATAALELDRQIVADAGSYAITGSAAALSKGLTLNLDAGAYAITGAAASLEFDRLLAAAAGSYALTGSTASLEFGRLLEAAAGSYSITGADATLIHGANKILDADAGSYAISGADADLIVAASAAQPAVSPTGGWDTPSQPDRKRVRKERQRLGIIPPDPEPVEIAGAVTHIGPARKRKAAKQITPREKKPVPERDYTGTLIGAAMTQAMLDAENEDIAVILLMA